MPPKPEHGSWPADAASLPDVALDRDPVNGGADHGSSPHLDAWGADVGEMGGGYGADGADLGGGYDEVFGYGDDGSLTGTVHNEPARNGSGGDHDDDFDDLDYEAYFDDDEDDLDDVDRTSNATRNALEWAVVLVGAVLVALLLRASLFQAFWIPSASMETTLLTNDRVLVNKISYRLHDINRGDVIVFARPDEEPGEIRDLIKRVIALPGETVEARENSIYINGQRLHEPYLDPGTVTADFGPTVVPEDEVFVMGDNRTDSLDSRWFGTVAEDRVVGRAFVLFWPVGRAGSL